MSTYVKLGAETVGHMQLCNNKARLMALGCSGTYHGRKYSNKCRDLLQKLKNRKKKPATTTNCSTQTHEVVMLDDARLAAKCKWTACGCGVTFTFVNELIAHLRGLIEHQAVAPAAKQYRCEWEGCDSKPRHNKELLMNHIMDRHTGNIQQ